MVDPSLADISSRVQDIVKSALDALKLTQDPSKSRDIFQENLFTWVDEIGDEGPTSVFHRDIANLWIEFAKMEISLRQFKQATKVFESAISCPIAGVLPDVWLRYAEFCAERGKLTNARKIFLRAISVVDSESVEKVWNSFLSFVNDHGSSSQLTLQELKNTVIGEKQNTNDLTLLQDKILHHDHANAVDEMSYMTGKCAWKDDHSIEECLANEMECSNHITSNGEVNKSCGITAPPLLVEAHVVISDDAADYGGSMDECHFKSNVKPLESEKSNVVHDSWQLLEDNTQIKKEAPNKEEIVEGIKGTLLDLKCDRVIEVESYDIMKEKKDEVRDVLEDEAMKVIGDEVFGVNIDQVVEVKDEVMQNYEDQLVDVNVDRLVKINKDLMEVPVAEVKEDLLVEKSEKVVMKELDSNSPENIDKCSKVDLDDIQRENSGERFVISPISKVCEGETSKSDRSSVETSLMTEEDRNISIDAEPSENRNYSDLNDMDDPEILLAQLRKSVDSRSELNEKKSRNLDQKRRRSLDHEETSSRRRRNRSPRNNRRRHSRGRRSRQDADISPPHFHQKNSPAQYFADIPRALPKMEGRPHLLFDDFSGSEPEPVGEQLMIELSRSLIDGRVFDIIRVMQQQQHRNETEILRRWQNLITTQIREGNDLYMKHQRTEIAASRGDTPDICEKHANERKEFSGRCKASQQQFIDITIVELKNTLREQQTKLHNAGVPSMFPTEVTEEVDLQRRIVALVMETGQICKEKSPQDDFACQLAPVTPMELEHNATAEFEQDLNAIRTPPFHQNGSQLNRVYAENSSHSTPYSVPVDMHAQRRRNIPGNRPNRSSAQRKFLPGTQMHRLGRSSGQQSRQSMHRRRDIFRSRNTVYREENNQRQRGRFHNGGKRGRNNSSYMNTRSQIPPTYALPPREPSNLRQQASGYDDESAYHLRREFYSDEYSPLDDYNDLQVSSNSPHEHYPLDHMYEPDYTRSRTPNGYPQQQPYCGPTSDTIMHQPNYYPRKY